MTEHPTDVAIEHWPIDRLLPYAANARTHSDDQVAQIAGSIAAFGFNVPCLVDERGVLIAGHGRLLAARQLELETVPVIRLEHLSEAQARAFRLADNRIAENAGWDDELLRVELEQLRDADFDLDLTGFELGEVDRLLQGPEDGPAGNEGAIHVPEVPVSQAGDLWILGDHRLLCGDSTRAEDVKRLMAGERAVLFATDPPYLVDYDGTNHPPNRQSANPNKDWSPSYGATWDDSSQGPELYDGFIKAAIDEAIAEDAAWYCWHASRRQAMVESCWEKAGAFVHQQIIWVKDHGILTRSHYLWKHEPCFYGWVKGKRPPRVGDETPPTTWNIAGLYGDERPDHPTPKPLDCFAIPMRQHVARGGLCYEPFAGSGSQIVAGESVGRRVYAMEISPVYVDASVLRWQKATGKTAVRDGDGTTYDQLAAAAEQAAA